MIERALNVHYERVMREIDMNGDSKAIYRHMGRLMKKGKSKSESAVSVRNEVGTLVDNSEHVK